MDKASEPEIRIIPIPALPMGVAMAAMVVLSICYDTFNTPAPAGPTISLKTGGLSAP